MQPGELAFLNRTHEVRGSIPSAPQSRADRRDLATLTIPSIAKAA
jgi:hypothetical protein